MKYQSKVSSFLYLCVHITIVSLFPAYSAKIVTFLRQSDIFNVLASRYEGTLTPALRLVLT